MANDEDEAPHEDELVEEDDEALPPDTSPEATEEAGLTEGEGPETVPTGDVELEDEEAEEP